mgnify:CR=1 FL=1
MLRLKSINILANLYSPVISDRTVKIRSVFTDFKDFTNTASITTPIGQVNLSCPGLFSKHDLLKYETMFEIEPH